MTEPKILEIMGHRVDLYKITNPALRRVIRERVECEEFLFSYGDVYHDGRYFDEYSDYIWGSD